jgi:hypothetical protein
LSPILNEETGSIYGTCPGIGRVGVDTGLYWPKKGKVKSGTTHIYFENELPSTASLEEIQEAINKHSC